MKKRVFLLISAFVLTFLWSGTVWCTEDIELPESAAENQKCFKCHGGRFYFYYNEMVEKTVKERMNPYFILDSMEYYKSNHKTFLCTDCHSGDYRNFPHDGNLRMEPKFNCLDCHGGDEAYAQFQFEKIEEEFQASVHSTKHSEDFTCWMCHNPHSYRISARTNENINEVIVYDNDICLSCHANVDKYQLISNLTNPNVLVTHEWLPNQALHFSKVRCIECHTEVDREILVAHKVQEKEKAVRKCVECHSQNSLLMATLYKFESKEKRDKLGFFNATMLGEHYIIGANRNYFLNVASLIIFGLTFLIIIVHAILRFLNK